MDTIPCSSQASVRPPGLPRRVLYSGMTQRCCFQRYRCSALSPLATHNMAGLWKPCGLESDKGVGRSRRAVAAASTSDSMDQEASSGSFLENIREERKLESTRFNSEIRESVIKAVQKLGNRVTAGDVAGRAGVSLSEAEEILKALAVDSSGHLEVSNDGEVVYILPSDFRNQLLARSIVLRWEPALKKFREVAGSVGRAAFGLGFIATVISVWVAVIAINSSGGNRDDNRSHRSSGMYMAFDLLDAYRMWWYFSRPSPEKLPGELGFMEAVYSCMFGDGDPNKTFEERRWNIIGRYIQSKDGVVIGEELAPFLDPPKANGIDDTTSSLFPDEGFMLPVLSRFGGQPQVSDQGDLFYVFPRFQQSASKISTSEPPQSFVQESNWKLTAAKKSQQLLVALLAAFNIVGVYVLKNAVVTIPELAPAAPGLVVLQVYAWSFIVVPLTRYFINSKRNREITERNEARQQAAVLIKHPSQDLERKLKGAHKLSGRQVLTDRDMMFSTKNSTSKFEGEEFDRRLNKLESSKSVDQ